MSEADKATADMRRGKPNAAAVFVPVARSRALVRAALFAVGAALLGVITWLIYRRIDFSAPGVSGRLVPASLVIGMLPFALSTVVVGGTALRWLLLAAWLTPVGAFASASRLELRLGPFGRRHFDADDLQVRYAFELSEDESEGAFEAFLPEEEQMAHYLPLIKHPSAREPVNRTILRFIGANEREVASAFRPVLETWRDTAAPQSDWKTP